MTKMCLELFRSAQFAISSNGPYFQNKIEKVPFEKRQVKNSPHTAKFRPWKVETYIAFESLDKAQAFERYLKTGSGHEFARRHF